MAGDADRIATLEADGDDAATARSEIPDALRRDTLSESECPGFQLGYVNANSPVIVTDDLIPPVTTAVDAYTPTSWPGSRLAHVDLADGTPSAADRGVPLAVLDVDADLVGDTWDRVALTLVHPDQHIAWRSKIEPTDGDACELLARVTGTTHSA